MVLSDLGCGSGSFDLAPFSCASLCVCSCTKQTRDVVCHLVGRNCGMTRVQSNAQCAQPASSGRLGVTKLRARFHFGRVGFETWSHTHNFHTHTTWLHTIFHTNNYVTRIFHTQLYHTQLFTYNFFSLSILHHLLCLSFLPRPASTFVSAYWKKLTCGVIRSFN